MASQLNWRSQGEWWDCKIWGFFPFGARNYNLIVQYFMGNDQHIEASHR
uniref:Uncharacterized protein n=1 Tax=Arundo donax TaxID=35708 RepID=A0A0A9HPN2_ARUDO